MNKHALTTLGSIGTTWSFVLALYLSCLAWDFPLTWHTVLNMAVASTLYYLISFLVREVRK